MPTFTYTARDGSGNPSNGTLTASSVEEVTQLIRREGKYPTSVQAADEVANGDAGGSSGGAPGSTGAKGIKLPRADVIQLSTQLAIMVETGVTLPEALDCIAAQSEKPK